MTALSGSFRSHEVPRSEMDRLSQYCSWLIMVAEHLEISLKFIELNVTSCNDKFLRIYDGANESAPLHGTYCGSNGSNPVEVSSRTNSLYIVSNSGNPARHSINTSTLTFQATYSSRNRTGW